MEKIGGIWRDRDYVYLVDFSIEVDYCLRDCAYVFVLDYLDYRNAP